MSVRDGGRGGASTPIQDVSVRAAAAGRAAVRSTADDVDSLGGGGGGSTNFYHNLHPHHKNSW